MTKENTKNFRIYDLVTKVTSETLTLDMGPDGQQAFKDAWAPSCDRFEQIDRWQALARKERATLSFQIARAAESIELAARARSHAEISAGDIWRGFQSFFIVKSPSPFCPWMSDIEAIAPEIKKAA